MNSDSFEGVFLTLIVLSLFVLVIIFAAIAAPFVGAGGAIVLWYYYRKNSPKRKEEEAREYTHVLYTEALQVDISDMDTVERYFEDIYGERSLLAACAIKLYKFEGYEIPPEPPPICNSIEGARYRDKLKEYIANKSKHEDNNAERFMEAIVYALPNPDTSHGMFEATMPLTGDDMEEVIIRVFHHDDLFHNLTRTLDANYREQNRVYPSDYKGENVVYAYFRGTPLMYLEDRVIGIDLPNRTEHMHILGGSGSGKTSLIQYMISKDLEEDCTVIVIDSQRQMIPKLVNLDVPIEDVTYISPHHSLGINLFDVGYNELRQDRDGERLTNTLVELLEFVLGSLIEAELTSKQQLVFQYAIQLTIAVPKANIYTFIKILTPGGVERYARYIGGLSKPVRDFFHDEFEDKQFDHTKREIAWRVWSMMKNPTFARIFAATENPIAMHRLMEDRRLILIDTDADMLQKGSGFFGRLFIAQILQAAQRRFQGSHRPVYVYIDECWAYLDTNLSKMLETARKANIGVILAHQYLDQITNPQIHASIMANTAIKFVSGVSDKDARTMAGAMHTTTDFITQQPRLQFAASIKGQGIYSIKVPVGVIEDMPQRSDMSELVSQMEEQYGYKEEPPKPPEDIAQPISVDEVLPLPEEDETAPVDWHPSRDNPE